MPPLVTNLPWLNNNQDPVATYQRSQQLVQAMQAQQAQERQQQAELAQRAREFAMQAQFQQRALALKEEEARSSVKVEADRLRQKGQALEFEQKMAEQQSQLLARPPEVVQLPGLPPGILHGGRFHPGQRTPDISGVGKAVPVHQDNDPTKPVIGHVAMTSERGGAFTRAVRPGETPEEKARATDEKAEERRFYNDQQQAGRFNRDELLRERSKLEGFKPGSAAWEDAPPEQREQAAGRLAEIQRSLDAYRSAPKKAEAGKPAKRVLAESRAALANKIEAEHPDWNQGQVMAETYKQIP